MEQTTLSYKVPADEQRLEPTEKLIPNSLKMPEAEHWRKTTLMRTVRLRNPLMAFDYRMFNILQLGFAFFIIFTAFQSCGVIQETVLDSVHNRTGAVDAKAGYYSLAIIYGVFTAFNFFAAAIVNVITAKWSMVVGGCCYALFLGSFMKISNAFLYSTSAVLGLGAAMIWVGQGQYLTKNSDEDTMGRNSAIVWAMFQCSLPVGGVFLYTQFRNVTTIGDETIRLVYISFLCMSGAGIIILVLLRRPREPLRPSSPTTSTDYVVSVDGSMAESPRNPQQRVVIDSHDDPQVPQVHGAAVAGTPATNTKMEESGHLVKPVAEDETQGFWQSFVSTFVLLKTLPMFLLAFVFIYTGLALTFWSGVYGTCLSFTEAFGESSKSLLAINIIFLGLGEILGGGLFGILGKKIHSRIGRSPIIVLGMFVSLVAYVLIFINIPADAPIHATKASAYITPNEYLALFCSFLLGFADSCWNTQIYSLLGIFYSENSAPAFALYKFFQSGAACGGFFYSGHLTLEWQLVILAATCVFGALAFFKVNYMAQQVASRNAKVA